MGALIRPFDNHSRCGGRVVHDSSTLLAEQRATGDLRPAQSQTRNTIKITWKMIKSQTWRVRLMSRPNRNYLQAPPVTDSDAAQIAR
eukprot:6197026-Pleurochrysis_carterae.AAC.3